MGRRVIGRLRLRREARGAALEQESRQDGTARAHGGAVVPASPVGEAGTLLAAASTDGRLLVFPLEELPELARGKGNKILAVPSKDGVTLAAICVLAEEQALRIDSGHAAHDDQGRRPRPLRGRARPARHGVAARLAYGGSAQRRVAAAGASESTTSGSWT